MSARNDKPAGNGPIMFEMGDPALETPAVSVADAPEIEARPAESALASGLQGAARRRGIGLGTVFWGALSGFVSLILGVAAYRFVMEMLALWPVLGWLAAGLGALVVAALLVFAMREMAGLARLRKVDDLRRRAEQAAASRDVRLARAVAGEIGRLYRHRPELDWARMRDFEGADAPLDAEEALARAETALLAPLDAQAEAAAARGARKVAAATALAPVALIDVAAALSLNLRMIREIAGIYDGRAGWLGSWRLLRAVAAHLVATGAVAMGDDLIAPLLGGGLAGKLSRRFGEGLINGALTARVGAAAIEVCRPLPFAARPRPAARALAVKALTPR